MIDVLTSATLKYLREYWWNDAFTEFLIDTLRPRPGNRILDVGCGTGMAEIRIGRLHLSQLRLFGVDLRFDRVAVARHDTAAHNQRVAFAAADAAALPFSSGVFASTSGVAILQQVADLSGAVSEMARVTRPGGRVVAVEPDNAARYWHSSEPAGVEAYAVRNRFFAAMHAAVPAVPEYAVGPRIPTLFAAHGVEPIEVRLFPVPRVHLGAPPDAVWDERHRAIDREIELADSPAVVRAGLDYRQALDAYERAARAAGAGFVEIQHATVFATVGQKGE